MSTTFMTAPSLLFTSESVTEGHPDKMCDQISDAVLDAVMTQDPMGRVACETAVKTGFVILLGEITTAGFVNFDELVRRVVVEIGYDDSSKGFDGTTCGVQAAIASQSPDIAQGVNMALEYRRNGDSEAEIAATGAGDQGMMFGFACNETPTLMPLPIDLAHRLTRRLAQVRKESILPWIRPDGKSQVTIEYSYGKPKRVHTVLISTQHAPDVDNDTIRQGVIEEVINYVLPPHLVDNDLRIFINPTGRFVIGGPMGDAGLTGRKIIVDTYGGMGRHGGGAFSGKDCTKVDRSAAYAARWVAKNLVAAGLAERCEVQLAYAIGVAQPLSINVETFGTSKLAPESLVALIRDHFDLRPGAIIRDLNLRRPIYRPTATYGHFGRDDIEAPWEDTGQAETLKAAVADRHLVTA
ncbi:MAG: methionine adenosyltransferase [Chloroflexi bacterium]|nr:methionine adenosyltransferase [Chloroflexota bacterium]MCI0579242.1 methionine adenosyltransferase [Chloroflexota bacterium]MCI0647099.1 methionine adenosyltransferase [Chloroflexota bacterium]MCI0725873.1 methionine adenosyltransferase [Chloroflexota bacterium]